MPATPSPLPVPSAQTNQNPLALSLTAIANGVPQIDPEVANGVAKAAQNPDQAVQSAQAAQGFTNAAQLANQLRQENGQNQLAAWQQLDATTQNMLKGAGYKPPAPHRGIFGTITHDLGQYGVHDTLNAMGSPLRAVQHGIRTMFAVANQRPDSNPGGDASDLIHALHSPGDWARAWNETTNGEHYILPQVKAQVQKKYGDQTYTLALRLAYGDKPADLVAKMPQAQQQQLAQQMMSGPVQQALAELQAGKVSEGRMLVRSIGMKPTSGAAKTISGLDDALTDWYADPFNNGLKGTAAFKSAKYFVQTGNDVNNLYRSSQAVQNGFADIAHYASQGDWAGLMTRHPQLAGIVDDLRAANIHTADDVNDFFSDTANLTSLIAGRPASLPGNVEGGTIPYLTRAGQLRLEAKGALQNAIDFLADKPARIDGLQPGDTIDHPLIATGRLDRIETATGKAIRHLLTLTPQGDSFNPYAANWFNKLRDVAMMSLPRARANQLLNDYANEATIGGRRLVYTGLIKEVLSAAGIDRVPGAEEWVKSLTDPNNIEAAASHQMYGPEGIDLVSRDGVRRPAAILRGQLSDEWAMPNYKTLYAQVKKLGVIKATNGALNNQMVDKFMSQIWKPLALARFGFSLRVAGEEAFGMLLRNGPLQAARARAAASAIGHLSDAPSEDGMLGAAWDRLTSHLPQAVKDRIVTPIDLAAAHIGDATSRALAGVEGRLAGDRYMDAARVMARNGILDPDGAFARYVSSQEEGAGNFYDSFMPTGYPRTKVWDHGRMVSARLSPTGAWSSYTPTAQVYTSYWYKRLREIASDPWARTALRTKDLALPDRIGAVADKLKKDEQWLASERSKVTTDGRLVRVGGTGDATLEEAAADHAKTIIDLVDHYTQDQAGNEIPGMIDHLLTNRRPPTVAALDELAEDQRPASVSGPEVVPSLDGLTGSFSKGVNAMFSVIGKQIDWISRQPMFVHNFAASLDAYQPTARRLAEMGMRPEDVEETASRWATDRALHLTLPYIHNPQLRSQFAVITRNVMPFWFAQEQFYKRWARTMKFAPWAFRQAQLISQGVYHSGFTHTDPTTGQRYFVYPGAGAVQDVLTHALGAFGYEAYLPIEANLRGQVKMASPGLERVGLPNVGPAVVIPLKVIQSVFPEADGINRQTASESYVQSLVPGTVQHIWQDFTTSPNNSQQFASAMMQAIQYLEASGHGIGTVATHDLGQYDGIGAPPVHQGTKPGDYVQDRAGKTWVVQADGQWRQNDPAALTAYMNRVKNWTRVFLITRTLFGFNAPASPENLFNPNHVNEDFQQLIKELPYQQAIATFMKLHPDATAYTVFQSKNQAGGQLPATTAAMNFMDANSAFFHDHPLAGAFFLPSQDSTGKFDRNAYLQQMQEGLRVRRTPREFWQEIAYQQAANDYFPAEQKKNALLSSGYQNRNMIDQAWTDQSQQFMKANPLFAQQLAQTGGAYTRADILQDLAGALNDPRLPETPQTEAIRTLYQSWVTYLAATAPYGQPGANTMSSSQRYQLEVEYARQVTQWLKTHPSAQGVYQRLIAPELSTVLNSEAQVTA